MAIYETAPTPTTLVDGGGDELDIDANGAVSAVITGPDGLQARVTNEGAFEVVPPAEGKSTGGEMLVVAPEPVIRVGFPYSVNPDIVRSRNNGGTITHANSLAVLSTGAAANQSAVLESVRVVRADPGRGVRTRFGVYFTAGVANSEQIVGLFNGAEGLAFGYNGTAFGILHRTGGEFEIQTLTITTKSTTAENITITLDGTADATVAVTDASAGDATTTANDIAAHDFSGVGRGWSAVAVGNTVVFQSYDASARSGTYTLSGATTAVGTFAETVVGITPTDTWVAQASWNGEDTFDGMGVSGVTLDPTKGNDYQIDFQAGFGIMRFFIKDPADGEYHLMHTVYGGNTRTTLPITNSTFPVLASVENSTNTSDVVIYVDSMTALVDGERKPHGLGRGVTGRRTLGSASETPILTIRVSEAFKGKHNQSNMILNLVSVAVEHTKPCTMRVLKDVVLTGASFAAYSTNSSILLDTTATGFTGGDEILSIPLGKTGNEIINLLADRLIAEFKAGEAVTITCDPESGTGAIATASLYTTEQL